MILEIIGIVLCMILVVLLMAAMGAAMNIVRGNFTEMMRALGLRIAQSEGEGRRCEYCGEEMSRDATSCSYCGSRAGQS